MTVEQCASIDHAPVWAAEAFGLALSADFEMPGLPAGRIREAEGRRCDLFLRPDPDLEADWSPDSCERLFEFLDDDGCPVSTLDVRVDSMARVWGLERGSFFVDGDGSSVRCYPSSVGEWQWRRFLVGQVLPLAALLNGLEILHASGVAIDGEALLFAGASRAGKSSVAAHLILHGAALVADDVVSIEPRQHDVLAHPGTPMIGLRHEEGALWSRAELGRLGSLIAESDAELLVAAAHPMTRPCPLRSMYLLTRSSLVEPVSFEQLPDPRYLLASTFNNVLRAPDRLVRMLDAYSKLSRSARIFRVNAPSSATAADVAEAVFEHHRAAGEAG